MFWDTLQLQSPKPQSPRVPESRILYCSTFSPVKTGCTLVYGRDCSRNFPGPQQYKRGSLLPTLALRARCRSSLFFTTVCRLHYTGLHLVTLTLLALFFSSSPRHGFFTPRKKMLSQLPLFFYCPQGVFFFPPHTWFFFYTLRFFCYPSKECFVGGKVD